MYGVEISEVRFPPLLGGFRYDQGMAVPSGGTCSFYPLDGWDPAQCTKQWHGSLWVYLPDYWVKNDRLKESLACGSTNWECIILAQRIHTPACTWCKRSSGCFTDNLTGFTQAIAEVFPQTISQLYVVHQIRNSCKYGVWKSVKSFLQILSKCMLQWTKMPPEPP